MVAPLISKKVALHLLRYRDNLAERRVSYPDVFSEVLWRGDFADI